MMNRYIIDEEQIDRFCGCISSIEAEKIIDEIRSNIYNPQAERKEFLGKIVLRIRQEFTQDDQEEWYLSAEDFENVLDEFNQEIEDDAEPHSKEKQG